MSSGGWPVEDVSMLMENPSKSNDFIYNQPGARAAAGRPERTESLKPLPLKVYTHKQSIHTH